MFFLMSETITCIIGGRLQKDLTLTFDNYPNHRFFSYILLYFWCNIYIRLLKTKPQNVRNLYMIQVGSQKYKGRLNLF
jgi:hypothetical protein